MSRRRKAVGLRDEVPYFDGTIAVATAAETWTIVKDSICEVPHGDGTQQRKGRHIVIKKIHLRLQLYDNATVTIASPHDGDCDNDYVRVCLVRHRNNNTAAVTTDNIFDNDLNLTDFDYMRFRDLAHIEEYSILWDKTFKIPKNVVGGFDDGGTNTYIFNSGLKFVKKTLKGPWPVTWKTDNTNGDRSAMTDGNIALIACSRSGNCKISGQFRIRFSA